MSLDLADACLDRLGALPPGSDQRAAAEDPQGARGPHLLPGPRTRSASTATTWSRAGEKTPWRLKLRSASFNNISVLPTMLPGCVVADMVAILGSMFFVVGDIDK